jgi:hypothetical protein
MDGHVAYLGEIRNAKRILVGNLKVTTQLDDLGVDGKGKAVPMLN